MGNTARCRLAKLLALIVALVTVVLVLIVPSATATGLFNSHTVRCAIHACLS